MTGRGSDEFAGRVLAAVRSVKAGRVASYGAVAVAAGRPGAARAVGRVLSSLPDGSDVPWWRVVNYRGEITIPRSGHAAPLQRALLAAEGVALDDDGRVPMARYGWALDQEDGDD
jgi:methylated-DNA-protein-cysteine methyltransferase related protein